MCNGFVLNRTNIPCLPGGIKCETPDAKIGDFVKYTKEFDKKHNCELSPNLLYSSASKL